MITTNTRRAAVALLATAGLLAGCGGDDKQNAQATTDPAAATTAAEVATPVATPTAKEKKALNSPTGKWATEVCTGLAKNSLEVQPPDVQPSNPKSTRESLISFFDAISKQLDGQVQVLKDAGDPPAGQKTYDSAIRRLEKIEKSVGKLGSTVKASSASSEKDINLVVAGYAVMRIAMRTKIDPVCRRA